MLGFGGGGGDGSRALAGVLFLTSGMTTLDAASTFLSSPWTAESFGGDTAKRDSMREYMAHSMIFSEAYAVISGIIARSWMPVVGATTANAYLWWLYDRAIQRAMASGSEGWGTGADTGLKSALWGGKRR